MQANFQDFTPEEIQKAALGYVCGTDKPLEELIDLCDNLFEMIEMDQSISKPFRNTVWHLFRSYAMYRDLVRKEGQND